MLSPTLVRKKTNGGHFDISATVTIVTSILDQGEKNTLTSEELETIYNLHWGFSFAYKCPKMPFLFKL